MKQAALRIIALAALAACISSCQNAKQPPATGAPIAKTVVTGTDPQTIDWEASSEHRLHGAMFAVAPGGKALAITSGRELIAIDLKDLDVQRFSSDGNELEEAAFSPDGNWLAALELGWSGPARIFVVLLRDNALNNGHNAGLSAVCHFPDDSFGLRFSKDSKCVYAFGGSEYMWTIADGRLAGERDSVGASVHDPVPLPTEEPVGKLNLVRSEDKQHLYVQNGDRRIELEPGKGVFHQGFGALSAHAIGAFDDESFCIWDARSGKLEVRVYPNFQSGLLIRTREKDYAYVAPKDYAPQPRAPGMSYDGQPAKVTKKLQDLFLLPS